MNLLVIRFSAMGDVALLTPTLVSLASNYPNVRITLVTRGNFASFFFNIPNLSVIGVNVKKYRGIMGIWNLYKELKKFGPYDKIIDLHGSLRSTLISWLFKKDKVKTFRIIKGRAEKNKQTRKYNKVLTKLPHTVDRYLDVFKKAGFPINVRKGPWINVDPDAKIYASEYFKSIGVKKSTSIKWIGFAPFAGHKLKEWPYYKSEKLIKMMREEFQANIFLFCSNEEKDTLQSMIQDAEGCYVVTGGAMGMKGEIGIMEKMDIVVGMDSSNVHIAALLKKPVVALYGTTHPYSGFGPYSQEEAGVLQIDTLSCRPCSMYGETTCYRKDFACMELIDPLDVVKRIQSILFKPQ